MSSKGNEIIEHGIKQPIAQASKSTSRKYKIHHQINTAKIYQTMQNRCIRNGKELLFLTKKLQHPIISFFQIICYFYDTKRARHLFVCIKIISILFDNYLNLSGNLQQRNTRKCAVIVIFSTQRKYNCCYRIRICGKFC